MWTLEPMKPHGPSASMEWTVSPWKAAWMEAEGRSARLEVAVLDAFIIEELKRRERERIRELERPQPQAPEPRHDDDGPLRQSDDEKPQRGVVIIDYAV